MINNIQPKEILKKNFDKAMYKFCKKLTMNAHNYYTKSDMSYRPVYKSAGGRKFIRVKSFETNTIDQNGNKVVSKGSIHCFVNSINGDIYKPASWKAPHLKGDYVRVNIFEPSTYENTDPHGGWLYHNSSYNTK